MLFDFKNQTMDFELHFSSIPEHRETHKIRHLLVDIIGLSILGCIAGCEGFEEIEEYGIAKEKWLKKYLKLPNGIPSHDTLERAFHAIQPAAFSDCFIHWVKSTFNISDEHLIHIDGKSSRCSGDSFIGTKMLHLVSAFAGTYHLSLAQIKVEDKSNEIVAVPELLKMLDIEGKTITIDAMGCQMEIAQQIIAQKGNYILAVKENQKSLLSEIEESFLRQQPTSETVTTEKNHGRIEQRSCSVITQLGFMGNETKEKWPCLNSIIRIISDRTLKGSTSTETRYYINNQKENASIYQKAIRSHWGIENRLHWVLDMLFDEDHCRKRKNNAAENFSLVRKIALNIIRAYKGDKRSLKRRRLQAGWRNDYLEELLKS